MDCSCLGVIIVFRKTGAGRLAQAKAWPSANSPARVPEVERRIYSDFEDWVAGIGVNQPSTECLTVTLNIWPAIWRLKPYTLIHGNTPNTDP